MHFNLLASIEVASTVLETAVGIAAALAGWGYWALVLQRLVAAPVELVAFWIACPWRPGRPSRAEGVRSMLAFGGNLTGFSIVMYVSRNIDNLLIGKFHGPAQLGFYSKAYNLLLVPLQRICGPIASVAVPALSRLTDTPERYRQAYYSIAAKIGLLTMPLTAFMIGASDWLVLIVLGEKWMETSQIFALLGISGLVEPFSSTILWLFISQGRTRQQFHWGLINSTFTVIAILVGLPWGAVGVAAAYSTVNVCLRVPFLFWFAGREGPVRTRDLYRIFAPFAAVVATTLISIFVFRQSIGTIHPVIGVIVAMVITAVATLLTLVILPSGRPTIREFRSILAILAKRKAIA
jgi:PST family polysaccharide transporter